MARKKRLHRWETVEGQQMTPRQTRFVAEYMHDCNATRAAVRAGYSAKNAGKIGPRLCHKPHVAAAIQAGLAEAAKRRQEARETAATAHNHEGA
jgi:phage terminase small subunit